jgi:hypothetical protein
MKEVETPAFGDRVRVAATSETEAVGIAGREGEVFGFTTPSVTLVDVVGGAPDDLAFNVSFSDTGESFWLRPDLIDLIDHNEGLEIRVGNVRAVRQADGSWLETTSSLVPHASVLSRVLSWFGLSKRPST